MKYLWRTKPYSHQVAAVKQLLRQKYGGALLMEPRTGKTKTTIDWLSILALKGAIDRAVIVCPTRVMGTWLQEFHIHCPLLVDITVWDSDRRKQPPPPVSKVHDLSVLIVNYEAFATPGKRLKSGRRSKSSGRYKVRAQIRNWVGDGSSAACVLDESHKIKNPSGKAANMLVTMGPDFARRLILTGTVITKANRAHDVYMQWKFLNPDRFSHLRTLSDFRNHFGRWVQVGGNGVAFPKYLGPRNLEELKSTMAKDAIIVRREDCFDLPPREDIVRFVDLKSSRAAYDQMASDMIARLESGEVAEASIELVRILRLAQITSGFVTTEAGKVERVGMEKAKALGEELEPLLEAGQKVVVAARWRPDLDLIEDIARGFEVPVWSIRGGKKREETDQAIREFRDHEDAGVIVIQPSSSSLGIDLSTASHMIWYGHTPSWVDFSQACDRIALSRSSTTFIHLVARSSVDETLLETLRNDGDVAQLVMAKPKEALMGHSLKVDGGGRIEMEKKV